MALDNSDLTKITKAVTKAVTEAVTKVVTKEKEKQDRVTKDRVTKSEQLAKISKRIEELKEKLEGGQLKADVASGVGIEYQILKKEYEGLISELKTGL